MEEQLIIPMTVEEFCAERDRIRVTYGDGTRTPQAKRDQELARLYDKSRWTQRALAEIESIASSYTCYRLRFGRFLNWLLTNSEQAETLSADLHETRFRAYWTKTDKNMTETTRFEDVKAMIDADHDKPATPRGKNIMVKRLLAEFGDGEFHAVRVMATKLDVPQEKLLTTLEGMRLHGFHHTEAERRRAPATDGGWRYRLRPHRGHVVPYDTLREELKPFLDELRYQGQQDQYKLAPFVFTNMAHKIEQALDKLAR